MTGKPLSPLLQFGRDQLGQLGQLADETLLQREVEETKDRITRMREGLIPASIEAVDAEYERLAAIMAAMERGSDIMGYPN
jgi:hypothetical protein